MFKFIDTIIDRIEGIPSHSCDRNRCLELTRINLMNCIDENRKILLIGSDIDSVALFAKDLCDICVKNGDSVVISDSFSVDTNHIILCVGADITSDPDTIINAKNSDAVIVVEEKDKSKLSSIDKSVLKIKELEKEILGFVIV